MRLPDHEREAHRQAFRSMSLAEKAEYVLAYYKLPIVLALIALVAAGSVLRYQLTHKDPLLYLAYVNVAIPEERDESLAGELLARLEGNPASQEIYRYRDLYVSEAEQSADHRYSYASNLKLLGAMDSESLDVVLMNEDAHRLLSAGGYLMDLDEALASSPELAATVAPRIRQGTVVLEDNRVEVELGEADEYEAVTEEIPNALDVTDALGVEGGLTGNVYLGIIGNTPRLDAALELISLLAGL